MVEVDHVDRRDLAVLGAEVRVDPDDVAVLGRLRDLALAEGDVVLPRLHLDGPVLEVEVLHAGLVRRPRRVTGLLTTPARLGPGGGRRDRSERERDGDDGKRRQYPRPHYHPGIPSLHPGPRAPYSLCAGRVNIPSHLRWGVRDGRGGSRCPKTTRP